MLDPQAVELLSCEEIKLLGYWGMGLLRCSAVAFPSQNSGIKACRIARLIGYTPPAYLGL
jgi:hypothetical protein